MTITSEISSKCAFYGIVKHNGIHLPEWVKILSFFLLCDKISNKNCWYGEEKRLFFTEKYQDIYVKCFVRLGVVLSLESVCDVGSAAGECNQNDDGEQRMKMQIEKRIEVWIWMGLSVWVSQCVVYWLYLKCTNTVGSHHISVVATESACECVSECVFVCCFTFSLCQPKAITAAAAAAAACLLCWGNTDKAVTEVIQPTNHKHTFHVFIVADILDKWCCFTLQPRIIIFANYQIAFASAFDARCIP